MSTKPRTPRNQIARTAPKNVVRKEPERERALEFLLFCERYSLTPLIQNSYVLSRLWAWFSRIEWSPEVKIPVPRFLSYRD